MKITTEPLENRQLRLTIEVDEERTQQAMRQAARQIAQQVNVPGYRKGKAPYEVVVQRFGEDTVRREAAEKLFEAAYKEAVKQEGIEPYAPGTLDEAELRPVTFTFTVPLPPTVDLGHYRDYRLEARQAQVPEEEVHQALEQIREQNAILELVDRAAALGDGVVIDLVGRTAAGAEFFKGDAIRILLDAASTDPAPGFAEALVGMKAGEERTFTLTLPADFAREELRGQEAGFTVKMNEVYESILPALDDDLARTVGSFDSFEELETQARAQLQQAAQEKANEEYAEQVLQAIIEQAQVEYPPMMLNRELDEVVKEVEQAVKSQLRLSMEDFLRFQNKTLEELRKELEPRAAARLKRALVLGEIITLEGLEVNEEEVGARIEEASIPWGVRADDVRASLSSDAGRQAMRTRLLANKAVQRLIAIAKGEAPEPGAAEKQERAEAEDTGQEAGSKTQDTQGTEQGTESNEQEARGTEQGVQEEG